MELLSAVLHLCEGNPSVTEMLNCDTFFVAFSEQAVKAEVADKSRHHDIHEMLL